MGQQEKPRGPEFWRFVGATTTQVGEAAKQPERQFSRGGASGKRGHLSNVVWFFLVFVFCFL